MVSEERIVRSNGAGKAILIGLTCLVAGVVLGRSMRGRHDQAEATWKSVDELNQMYLVPGGYNFVESNKSYEGQLIGLIHDQLLHFDPVQNQLVSGLARTYDVSSDGLTWTFHLRDASTPDGLSLGADDVVFSFNLGMDPRFDNKRRGNFIQNNKPIVATATGPQTVTFRLAEPFHSFPWAIANLTVVPKATFAAVSSSEKEFRQAVGVQQPDPKYLRGFGPYFVESQDTQQVPAPPQREILGAEG